MGLSFALPSFEGSQHPILHDNSGLCFHSLFHGTAELALFGYQSQHLFRSFQHLCSPHTRFYFSQRLAFCGANFPFSIFFLFIFFASICTSACIPDLCFPSIWQQSFCIWTSVDGNISFGIQRKIPLERYHGFME